MFPGLQVAFDLDEACSARPVEESVCRWPLEVDPNLLHGHPSIVRWTNRLSVKEYLDHGRQDSVSYFYHEKHGPWLYLVMSAGCSDTCRQVPEKVDSEEAALFISLLRLPPVQHRHEDWLRAQGFIRDGHLSWSRFSGFWRKYAVVRVDTRLVEQCFSKPYLWSQAVVDLTACDEFVNARQCEHQLVARCMCGDTKADPFFGFNSIAGVAGAHEELASLFAEP